MLSVKATPFVEMIVNAAFLCTLVELLCATMHLTKTTLLIVERAGVGPVQIDSILIQIFGPELM